MQNPLDLSSMSELQNGESFSKGVSCLYKGEKLYSEIYVKELQNQNEALKEFFKNLINGVLSEIDKDGWCRLVVTKEQALEMKEFIDTLS